LDFNHGRFFEGDLRKKIPIVGICFGHQLLAQALGGKVEKFSQGWSIGHTPYTVEDNSKDENRKVNIAAWHQDQVTVLPDDAVCTGSSDFCKYAFIEYGETAYSIQAHPEFTSEFIGELVSLRSASMPEELISDAHNKSALELDTAHFAKRISEFFKSRQ
jgi:GMP synthase (glutamine-hydrolysing)